MRHLPAGATVLTGSEREFAANVIRASHYTHSVPSGKSHYVAVGNAIVIWSIPANCNIGKFLLPPGGGVVWELSRLWAPDGHERNLLTKAIGVAVAVISTLERPDALVSYADPNAGHSGGVYRAASWFFHGQSEEARVYRHKETGQTVARRAFHSGRQALRKHEIEALGYEELKLPGKLRFVRPLSRRAKRLFQGRIQADERGGL